MGVLRVLRERDTPAPWGLAVDEHLSRALSEGRIPPSLHLYSFQPSVILGYFQDAYAEANLEVCERLGVAVNRRATGGGAILMTPDQLGIALAVPCEPSPAAAWQLFVRFAEALATGLREAGIEAHFRPKNDLEVEGRKIAGLASSSHDEGVFLFHASVLVDLDLDLMLQVLNIPLAKLEGRQLESASQRVTTLREVVGEALTVDEVADLIVPALAQGLDLAPIETSFSDWEREAIQGLVDSRYGTREWVFEQRHPKKALGQSESKLPGGLVRVYASKSGGILDQVVFTGDFLLTEEQVNRLEASLKGLRADIVEVTARIELALADYVGPELPARELAELVLKAID